MMTASNAVLLKEDGESFFALMFFWSIALLAASEMSRRVVQSSAWTDWCRPIGGASVFWWFDPCSAAAQQIAALRVNIFEYKETSKEWGGELEQQPGFLLLPFRLAMRRWGQCQKQTTTSFLLFCFSSRVDSSRSSVPFFGVVSWLWYVKCVRSFVVSTGSVVFSESIKEKKKKKTIDGLESTSAQRGPWMIEREKEWLFSGTDPRLY